MFYILSYKTFILCFGIIASSSFLLVNWTFLKISEEYVFSLIYTLLCHTRPTHDLSGAFARILSLSLSLYLYMQEYNYQDCVSHDFFLN